MRDVLPIIVLLLSMTGSSVGDSQVVPPAPFINLFARHFSRNAVTMLLPLDGLPEAVQIIKNLR